MNRVSTILVGCLLATGALAQSTAPSNPTPGTTMKAPSGTGQDAAAGNGNQPVATTDANAMQPAKGANSFTEGEARRRMERDGYSAVADLKKDDDGVWRGRGTKDGASANVWLDYKGNIGRQ